MPGTQHYCTCADCRYVTMPYPTEREARAGFSRHRCPYVQDPTAIAFSLDVPLPIDEWDRIPA